MNIRSVTNGVIVSNVSIFPTKKVPDLNVDEHTVETYFEEHLRDMGYGLPGKLYTKQRAKSYRDSFVSKTGSGLDKGAPDYIFYDNEGSDKIIAIGDVKTPDNCGRDRSLDGLNDCTDIYLKDYNKKHPDTPIRICFGYDGINFVIKYLTDNGMWEDIIVDDEAITTMPPHEFLRAAAINGNSYTTQLQKNVDRELLEPYFARCDSVFRNGKTSLSAVDKAAEISILIFLRIFSKQGKDKEFADENGSSVWNYIEKGNTNAVNKLFKNFLNTYYENVFPNELIKIDSQMTRDLANIINKMFSECNIDSMTDIKGNALEYYQKDSKDKKIGEFFTPRHLIELMTFLTNPQIEFEKNDTGEYCLDEFGNRIIKKVETIYDPACGSGGFLIGAFQDYLKRYSRYGVTNEDLKQNVIFGNELKDRTVMLTKLNMILLGDGHNHISNENALGYEKRDKVKKAKDSEKKDIELSEEEVVWKKNYISGRSVLIEKSTGLPVFESVKTAKFYLAKRNKNGKLVKSKDALGKYICLEEKEVFTKVNEDGEECFFRKSDNVDVVKSGKLEHKYYRGNYELQKDGSTPVVEYVNVEPVNPKVRNYHKDFFGKFDIVMANHPYAVEEPQKPDQLFLEHMIQSVRVGGRISCIVSETLLFHREYEGFREWALENITVEGIISLPQGVFNPYTDVKTSILLLKKEKPAVGHKSWLVELKNDGFDLNLSRSPSSENDIPKVKSLWECWGGYNVQNVDGNNVYKSFHKEETGFAEFHTLDSKNWCVKRYNTSFMSLGTRYELKPISELLIRRKQIIDICDDEQYKRVTIQVKNRGVVLRDESFGDDIGTKKQFIIKKGQFLISKIDARNGAYDIVSDELDGAIITGNFWAFDINEDKVLPRYLTYLMRHEFFQKLCIACSYGSTNRWYLDEDTFNNFKVPIPEFEEQCDILKKIDKHNRRIEELKAEINDEENSIMNIIDEIIVGGK